jgi:hypothetical protein
VNIAELALPSILTYMTRQETKTKQDKKITNKDKDKIRQILKKRKKAKLNKSKPRPI